MTTQRYETSEFYRSRAGKWVGGCAAVGAGIGIVVGALLGVESMPIGAAVAMPAGALIGLVASAMVDIRKRPAEQYPFNAGTIMVLCMCAGIGIGVGAGASLSATMDGGSTITLAGMGIGTAVSAAIGAALTQQMVPSSRRARRPDPTQQNGPHERGGGEPRGW